jgi:hypothetical protein
MPLEVFRRDEWDGEAKELGHLFRMHKAKGKRQLQGVCRLMSHVLGWELRLEINGDLQRSAVCRSQDEILNTME